MAGIFTHAHRRGYPRRLLHSTWTRFLVRYWDAASVSVRELRSWFHRVWKEVVATEAKGAKQHTHRQCVAAGGENNKKGKERRSEGNKSALSQLIDLLTPPAMGDQVSSSSSLVPWLDPAPAARREAMDIDDRGVQGSCPALAEVTQQEEQLIPYQHSEPKAKEVVGRDLIPAQAPNVNVNVAIQGAYHVPAPPPPQIVERHVAVPVYVERPVLVLFSHEA